MYHDDGLDEASKNDKYMKECAYSRKKHEEVQKRYAGLTAQKPLSFALPARKQKSNGQKEREEGDRVKSLRPEETQDLQQEQVLEPPCPAAEEKQGEKESEEKETDNPGVEGGYRVQSEELLAPLEEKDQPFQQKGKSWTGRIFGAVLAAAVLMAAVLFVLHLWPAAAEKILGAAGIDTVFVSGNAESEEPEENGGETTPAAIEQADTQKDIREVASEDKTALIASIAPDYPQIGAMGYNARLKYIPGGNYPIEGLAESEPLTDNILYEVNGEPVYCDETLIRCLAGFNTAWINYINTGDRSVFQLINMEGKAAEDASGFNTQNLKENFRLLEIGEIRRQGDTFFVWTHEEIEAIRGDMTQVVQYYWIYTIIMRGNHPLIDGYAIDGYYEY